MVNIEELKAQLKAELREELCAEMVAKRPTTPWETISRNLGI